MQTRRVRTWGMRLDYRPWAECFGVPRLGSDWSIHTPRVEFSTGGLSKEPMRLAGAGKQLVITRAVGETLPGTCLCL